MEPKIKKPPICKNKGCGKPKKKRPGNTTLYFPYCEDCLVSDVLNKVRIEKVKSKEELEKARQEVKIIRKTDKQRALKLADDWFSKYIRFKYSFEMNGSLYCECYTCGHSYLMKAMDNGHWQKRENKLTRFNENNARPQCTECNDHKKGDYAKFELHLISEIGIEEVEIIKKMATQAGEDSFLMYKEQADKYRNLCNELFKERKQKNPWK